MSVSGLKTIFRRNEREFYAVGVFAMILLHLLLVLLLAGLIISASDEAVYLDGFIKIFDSTQVGFQPPGWSYADVNVIKILYFPAYLLNKIGFSEITSMRLNSLIYIVCTFLILLKFLKLSLVQDQYRKVKWLTLLIFLIPSKFFFTSLATRDCMIALFLTFTMYNFLKLDQKIRFYTSFAYVISLAIVFAIKPHYYLIILASVSLVAGWKFIHKNVGKKFLFLILTLSISPMFFFSGSIDHQLNSIRTWQQELNSRIESPTTESPTTESPLTDLSTLIEISNAAKDNRILNLFLESTGISDKIAARLANPPSSEAAIVRAANTNIGVNNEDSTIGQIGKFVKIFLFPAPFLDNGSFLLNLFAFEIIFWLLLYLCFLRACWGWLRRRESLSTTSVFSGIVLISYVLMSLITEENVQVALRHRSVFAILILINLGTFYKPSNSPKSI